jgi:hypothetical protein
VIFPYLNSRQTSLLIIKNKANPTFVRLLETNFELQGIYCCVGGDELLFDDDACVVSQGEIRLDNDDDHD